MNTNGVVETVPIFAPPTPTFEPPKNTNPQFNGPSCHYHKDEPAVARCARCGKNICQDCFDNYGVSNNEYAGRAICYDCCQQMVSQNVEELTRNKNKIKFQFILSMVGMVIGLILGIEAGISSAGDIEAVFLGGLIYAGVGGMFFSVMKFYLYCMWLGIKESFKTLSNGGGIPEIIGICFGLVILIVIGAIIATYYTIVNTIDYIIYLKKTCGFIESDTIALQEMKDYMEYTMIRNQNRGVDLETLFNQKSELANNSYARMVQEKGEDGAEVALRDCVARINENGEIIRSFNNRVAA